jgi:hypothetical protein
MTLLHLGQPRRLLDSSSLPARGPFEQASDDGRGDAAQKKYGRGEQTNDH